MGECSLYLGRREVGRLRWDVIGGKQHFFASCPAETGMIYRVVLHTESGMQRLGVMLPEDETFHLCRTLPAELLPHCALVDRTLPGEAHLPGLPLAFSAFSRDDLPERLPVGCDLRAAWWNQTCYLLYPFQPGQVCDGAPFLSISSVIQGDGKHFGVFCWQNDRYIPLTDRLREKAVLK